MTRLSDRWRQLEAQQQQRAARAQRGGPGPIRSVRSFAGADVSRLTAGWRGAPQHIDEYLRTQLRLLRARSRELAVNSEYAAKFLRMVRTNVVGPNGPILQARVRNPDGTPDTWANQAIEAAWHRQCDEGNFEVSGRLSFAAACKAMVTAAARDGEYLYRVVIGQGAGEFGFQVQLLDADRLDVLYHREAASDADTRIVMGVEMDAARRPVAYWINTSRGRNGVYVHDRERIPASEIRHRFMAAEAEQTRGYPWIAPGMHLLHQLERYREAAVVAARAGASKMGFYETPDGQVEGLADGQQAEHELLMDAEPGTFGQLPPGYKFHEYDPTYPHEQFGDFLKAALRGVASGWGCDYNQLGNDLEGVSLSTIRMETINQRDEWMGVQEWFLSDVDWIYRRWFDIALLGGRITMPNGSALPAAKREKFLPHVWQPKRWQWPDPLKDMQAMAIALDRGVISPQQVAAQSGRDIEDVIDDIAAFQSLLAAKGVSLTAQPYAPPAPVDVDQDP